jgi:SAM-dependent methyltransferase
VGGIAQGVLNPTTWSTAACRRDLDRNRGFTDPGEQAALEYVREAVRGRAILDLGVGTGRTIPFLTALSRDYCGIDYLPSMVEVARARYPSVHIEGGDARSLQSYPSACFGFVNFSCAGIDAVPAADRRRVLQAVRRVLMPSGVFVFSTLNLEGPSFRERPWRLRVWRSRNPLRALSAVVDQVTGAPVNLWNWMQIRGSREDGPGYSVAPQSVHHYRVLAHYTTLQRQLDELRDEGFDADGPVFESRFGARVTPGDDTSASDWFHVVTRPAPRMSVARSATA